MMINVNWVQRIRFHGVFINFSLIVLLGIGTLLIDTSAFEVVVDSDCVTILDSILLWGPHYIYWFPVRLQPEIPWCLVAVYDSLLHQGVVDYPVLLYLMDERVLIIFAEDDLDVFRIKVLVTLIFFHGL